MKLQTSFSSPQAFYTALDLNFFTYPGHQVTVSGMIPLSHDSGLNLLEIRSLTETTGLPLRPLVAQKTRK